MNKQLKEQIETVRELLLSQGWESYKRKSNMRNGLNLIQFDELDGDHGPVFDINLYQRESKSEIRYLGTIFGFDNTGQPFCPNDLVSRVVSSF